MCRFSAVSGAEIQGESSAWKQSRERQATSSPLECSSMDFYHEGGAKDDGNFFRCGESSKEVPNYLLDLAECRADLHSSPSASKVEKRTSTLGQDGFGLKMF